MQPGARYELDMHDLAQSRRVGLRTPQASGLLYAVGWLGRVVRRIEGAG